MAESKLLLPDGHGTIATLDRQGFLEFVVFAGDESPIRGTEMFDLVIRSFGAAIRGIKGVWRTGFQGQASVNLDKGNELAAQGIPLDEAVLQAWTVTRAKRWGFSRVTVLGPPKGMPGAYSKIDVLIEK
jgi:hypothetical protein